MPQPVTAAEVDLALLPAFPPDTIPALLNRHASLHTTIPDRPTGQFQEYTITSGDSLFAISKSFEVEPETILWANYDVLQDNPDMLSVGMTLKIPTANGILYKWKAGDSLEKIVAKYKAEKLDVLAWPANNLDMANPELQPDQWVMIPGGSREFVSWFVPTIPRGRAGVNVNIPGACETAEGGAVGTGAFGWPAASPYGQVSGNEYWSGHLAIDVAAGTGTPILASDSGVIVFAGPARGGYGNMIMIDHGNGWQTLYAHLSSVSVRCGQSVGKGGTIGHAGSTGNSTGPHLHFEVRYSGGFVNPWSVLQ